VQSWWERKALSGSNYRRELDRDVSCLLSCFLCSINGLARELKKRGQGVDIGGRRVQMLLYADDIVLLAETPDDLQRMLDVVSEYSRKWKVRVNPR